MPRRKTEGGFGEPASYETRKSFKVSRSRPSEKHLASRVDGLVSTLEATNNNLRDVDRLLEEYRDVSSRKASSVHKLRRNVEDLEDRIISTRQSRLPSRSSYIDDKHYDRESLRRPYTPTSPIHQYVHERPHSDVEYEDERDEQRSKLKRSAVRFYDDMDTSGHLHHLHQSVRNLSSDQLRMHDELEKEVERRNRLESDHKKTISELEKLKLGSTVSSIDTGTQSVGSRVDQRLQVIQDDLKAQRLLWQKKQEEASKLATELKQAVDTEMTQKETDDSVVKPNYQASVVDDLRRQLQQAEDEKKKMQDELRQSYNNKSRRRKQNALSEDSDEEFERQQLDLEVRELRSQVAKAAVSLKDFTKLQQDLERSEQQRAQLSDHIQGLAKEVENKEKQCSRAVNQLHEVHEKLDDCERQRNQCLVQLEDTLGRLREATKEAERYSHELKELQATLTESEHKRDTFKNKAQDAIKQWKNKCNKLEVENERLTKSVESTTNRCEQLTKEIETVNGHSGTRLQQAEHMRRELNELLAVRAQQDEIIRLREIEVNEMKSVKLELEQEVRDLRQCLTEMQNELSSCKEKMTVMYEDRCKMEDQTNSLQASQLMSLNQVQRLQEEVTQLNTSKLELSTQLSAVVAEKRELRERLQELLRNEAVIANQTQMAMQKVKEERESSAKQIDALKNELVHYRNLESRQLREASLQLKKFQAENEAEIQSLQLELKQEKTAAKGIRKQNEKLKTDADKMKMELTRKDEEVTELQKKYEAIKLDIIAKCDATDEALFRAREAESNTSNLHNAIVQKQKDMLGLQTMLTSEMDSLVESACSGTSDITKVLPSGRDLGHDIPSWLTDMKSKFQWLKTEFAERFQTEQRLRSQFQNVLLNAEKDGKFLLAEIERQNKVLDELANQRLVIEGKEVFVAEPDLEEIHKEKEKIEQRYVRLQETISQLRRDVMDAGRSSRFVSKQLYNNSIKNGDSPSKSSKRLTFADDV